MTPISRRMNFSSKIQETEAHQSLLFRYLMSLVLGQQRPSPPSYNTKVSCTFFDEKVTKEFWFFLDLLHICPHEQHDVVVSCNQKLLFVTRTVAFRSWCERQNLQTEDKKKSESTFTHIYPNMILICPPKTDGSGENPAGPGAPRD